MTERVVSMILKWANGQHEEVLAWLTSVGCVITRQEPGCWIIQGIAGIKCGLLAGLPWDVAPLFGFLLAGEVWPVVFPGLLRKSWKAWKKSQKRLDNTPIQGSIMLEK